MKLRLPTFSLHGTLCGCLAAFLFGCGFLASASSGAELKALTNSIGMKLIRLPAGEFVMGSPSTEKGRRADEPQRKVRLTQDFFIGQREVTRGQFRRFVESTGFKTDPSAASAADTVMMNQPNDLTAPTKNTRGVSLVFHRPTNIRL